MQFIKSFLFAFVFLLQMTCYSQNWQTVVSGKEYYFQDNESYYRSDKLALIVDSIQLNSTDSIFYNYKQVDFKRHVNNCQESWTCYRNSDTSWIGSHVVIKNDGANLFFNEKGDTIKINSRAEIDSTWILFNDTSGFYFEGKIISIDDSTYEDTIKTISLTYRDNNEVETPHFFNGLEIKISKNKGFFQLYRFLDFPKDTVVIFSESLKNKIEIKNFGAKQIFDFDIGDEFHYKDVLTGGPFSFYSYDKYFIKKVISKTQSFNEDTINYRYFRKYFEYAFSSNIGDTIYKYNDTIQETIIISNFIHLELLSNQLLIDINGNSAERTTLFSNKGKIYHSPSYTYHSNCGCLDTGIDCAGGSSPKYYEIGLGLKSIGYCNMSWPWHSLYFDMVYYKKTNGEEWGTPIPDWRFTGVEEQSKENAIKLYPNPVVNTLTIEGQDIENILLYNQLGQLLHTEITFQSKNKVLLNTSALMPGVYFLSVKNRLYKFLK